MSTIPRSPYLPDIIEEIRQSPVYHRFINLLKVYGIRSVCDCHAHVSSGRDGAIKGAPLKLTPEHAFAIGDVKLLYNELFRSEGIDFMSFVFDTPLPSYDLVEKNEELLSDVKSMRDSNLYEIVPFAVVTPDMDYRQVRQWVEDGVRGFKMTPRTASPSVKRGVISDISLAEMLSPEALWLADSYSLPIVVHLPQLVVSPRMRPSLKYELLRIVAKFPNMRIILAHLGQAQTPGKMEDLLGLIQGNGLQESIWMDISAVTVPSVLAMALESDTRLLFGTDIDFTLAERGRYIMFKVTDGQRVLANESDKGNIITALVSTNFGEQLKQFVLEAGIELDAPLLLFQYDGLAEAAEMLKGWGKSEGEIQNALERLFYGNARQLIDGEV